jgi:hypothetical protein
MLAHRDWPEFEFRNPDPRFSYAVAGSGIGAEGPPIVCSKLTISTPIGHTALTKLMRNRGLRENLRSFSVCLPCGVELSTFPIDDVMAPCELLEDLEIISADNIYRRFARLRGLKKLILRGNGGLNIKFGGLLELPSSLIHLSLIDLYVWPGLDITGAEFLREVCIVGCKQVYGPVWALRNQIMRQVDRICFRSNSTDIYGEGRVVTVAEFAKIFAVAIRRGAVADIRVPNPLYSLIKMMCGAHGAPHRAIMLE